MSENRNNVDWSKDFDFIEEGLATNTEPLDFHEASEIEISESETAKSPYKIRGKVVGCIAPIGTLSRNGRLYESTLWHDLLARPEIQERLATRTLYGTIRHDQKRVDDTDFREGNISHLCSCLEVREDKNGKPFLYGELEILDTPAGRILEGMYKGGAGLYVSTRGAGKLVDVPGKPYKLVQSSSYFFESIDFVLRPGFIEAKPVFEDVTSETPSVSESQDNSLFTEAQLHKKAQEIKAQQKAPKAKKALKDFVADKEQTNPVKDESSARFFTKQELKKETNEELEVLKSQIQQLAGIVEKVVDSIYEKDEEPIQEENSDVKKSAILAALGLLSEANLSEEALIEIVEEIKKGI